MKLLLNFIFACWPLQVQCGKAPKLFFPYLEKNTLSISENENISLIFWLNTSACQDPSGDYRMEVETRKSDGGIEYDGKLARWNNTCIITSRRATSCTSDYGPAELFKKVNRSHTQIVVRWTWEDNESRELVVNEATVELSFPDNAEDVEGLTTTVFAGSATFIPIIVIIVVAVIASIILVYRKCTTEPQFATKIKAYIKRLLKPQMEWNHSGKDTNKYLHSQMEGGLLTRKTNEKESKLLDNQKVSKQEQLLHILQPDSTLESEGHV